MADAQPSPTPEKPSAQGYIKDKPSNVSQDKQLKDMGIGPGGADKGDSGDKGGADKGDSGD